MSLCVVSDISEEHSAFTFRVKHCKEKCSHVWRYTPRSTCSAVLRLGLLHPEYEGAAILQNILSYNPNDTE